MSGAQSEVRILKTPIPGTFTSSTIYSVWSYVQYFHPQALDVRIYIFFIFYLVKGDCIGIEILLFSSALNI